MSKNFNKHNKKTPPISRWGLKYTMPMFNLPIYFLLDTVISLAPSLSERLNEYKYVHNKVFIFLNFKLHYKYNAFFYISKLFLYFFHYKIIFLTMPVSRKWLIVNFKSTISSFFMCIVSPVLMLPNINLPLSIFFI